MFEWEGKVNIEKETVLILKTIESKFQKLEKLISENHTYETPCILKLDISKGNKKFLNWLQSTME
jgi:periplasmic divalent cation tolerance protein